MDTDRWDNVNHQIEADQWAAFDYWHSRFQKALVRRDIAAIEDLAHPSYLPPKAFSDTPLNEAILCGSLWGVEHLMGQGRMPSESNLDTFFYHCVGYDKTPGVLLDMWQAWMPWLEQQDVALRGHALASFLWWARPYKVNDQGLCGRAPLMSGLSWESLQVSEWAQGCWDIPVLLQERVGDPFWVCEGLLSPLQRAWLGQGTALIERLLEAGASPDRLHPTSALPQWRLTSVCELFEQALKEGWDSDQRREQATPAWNNTPSGHPHPVSHAMLRACLPQLGRWMGVLQQLRVARLNQALPAAALRVTPAPRF